MMFLFFSLWRSLTEGRTYRLCIDGDGSRSTLQPGDSLVNVFISPLQAQQILNVETHLPHLSLCFNLGFRWLASPWESKRNRPGNADQRCPRNADRNLRRQPQVNMPCVSTCAAALASFSETETNSQCDNQTLYDLDIRKPLKPCLPIQVVSSAVNVERSTSDFFHFLRPRHLLISWQRRLRTRQLPYRIMKRIRWNFRTFELRIHVSWLGRIHEDVLSRHLLTIQSHWAPIRPSRKKRWGKYQGISWQPFAKKTCASSWLLKSLFGIVKIDLDRCFFDV